ncbi:hypothetical protein GCM10007385_28200 [Tateyamaria omphalii]|uniref:hypothetical protein n=1 Tax=Tateyamaria omphalii TaxID=299262 RepID=UPI0019CE0D39|nr:hypothetical protein [Tateyamaria omphalii]GGX58018.1 hypothetical protein GCM10007385_28200 [Tateyamaria omphalii]
MKRFSLCIFLLSLVAGSWSQNAYAQNLTIQIAPDFAMSNLNRELLDRRNKNQNPHAKAPAIADEDALRFIIDPVRRAENLRSFVARTQKTDPAGAARLSAILASVDVMGMIANAMNSVDLEADNVADAYAVWWISAYQGSQGVTDTPSRETYQAVRVQSANILLSTPTLVNASQAEKQQLAEAYLLQAALIDSAVDELQSDPTQLDALKSAVAEGAMASGLDLALLELVADGFRLR